MEKLQPRDPIDLDDRTDEELLALIRAHGPQHAATHVLLLRYHRGACACVRREARRRGLAEDLIADAQQEAVLGTLEAIRAYDPIKAASGGGRCPYATFLWMVLRLRCADFVRNTRQPQRYLDRSHDVQAVHDGGGEGACPFAMRCGEDPARLAEKREELERWHAALERLSPLARWWLEETAATPVRQLAPRLGLPYHTAKRRRRAALAELAKLLRDKDE